MRINAEKRNEYFDARYIGIPLILGLVITLIDSLGVFLVLRRLPAETLALVLFLEGGAGLIVGVAISLSSTPSVSTFSERLLRTSPWSRDAERYAERVGWRWLIASTFLIVIGFLASAL
jgi:hypothetical protein